MFTSTCIPPFGEAENIWGSLLGKLKISLDHTRLIRDGLSAGRRGHRHITNKTNDKNSKALK